MKTWQIKKLGEIAENLDSKRIPVDAGERNKRTGDIPYYGANGQIGWIDNYLFDEPLLLVAEDGGNWGPYQDSSYIITGKSWVNNHAHVLRAKDIFTLKYLNYYLNYNDLKRYTSGTTRGKLNQKALNSIDVLVPPVGVKEKLVEKLDAIRKLQELNNKKIEKAEELFNSNLKIKLVKKKGWKELRLEELCTVTSSKRIYASEYVKQGIPFFRSKEIAELANNREIQTELFISQTRFNELRAKYGCPKRGDVLLTAIGTIGEIYIMKLPTEFYFKDGNVLWLKDFKEVNSAFLKLALQVVIERLRRASSGSAYKALTIDNLKKIVIAVPTLTEQKQIAGEFEFIESSKITLLKQKQLLHEFFESTLNKVMKG